MLPGMIEMIVRIIGARIVADPLIVGVYVRSVGMAVFVYVFWRCRMLHRLGWSRTMRRNVTSADAVNRRRRSGRVLAREQEQNRSRTVQELLEVISYEPPR
jgi:hypothetical protein